MSYKRKNGEYFIGLYLDKQQYDIIHIVAKHKQMTISDLLRMSIVKDIEPEYQGMLASGSIVNVKDNS